MSTETSLHERLTAARAELGPAGLRVAEFLLNHPERAAVASAAEISTLTGTSDATVVRTVKILGYSGMPELKRALGAMLARHNPRVTLSDRIDKVHRDRGAILDLALSHAEAMIAEARQRISPATFQATVDICRSAETVQIVGFGPAAAVAEYATIEFNRIGRRAAALTTSGFRFADALINIRAGDAVLLIAPLLHVREIQTLLDQAARVNASVVLISETLGARLAGQVAVTLPLPSSRYRLISAIACATLLVDALLLGLAADAPQPALDTWAELNRLRADIVGEPLDVAQSRASVLRITPNTT